MQPFQRCIPILIGINRSRKYDNRQIIIDKLNSYCFKDIPTSPKLGIACEANKVTNTVSMKTLK